MILSHVHTSTHPPRKRSRDSRFKVCHRGGNLSWCLEKKVRTDGKNNISTVRIQGTVQAKGLPNNPFYSISLDCPLKLSVDADANPVVSQVIGTKDQGKPFSMITFSLPVDLFKLPPLS